MDISLSTNILYMVLFFTVIRHAEGEKPVCSGVNSRLVNGTCFTYYNEFVDWYQAKSRCEVKGNVLASVSSSDQIKDIVNNQGLPDQAWIGASDLVKKGQYVWVADNRSATELSSLWGVGEPNNQFGIEDCVTAVVSFRVNDAPCTARFPYICMELQRGVHKTKDNAIIIIASTVSVCIVLLCMITAFVVYKRKARQNTPTNRQHPYDSLQVDRNGDSSYNQERYARVNTGRAPMAPPPAARTEEHLYDYISEDLTPPKELLRPPNNGHVPYYSITRVTARDDNVHQTLPKQTPNEYVELL